MKDVDHLTAKENELWEETIAEQRKQDSVGNFIVAAESMRSVFVMNQHKETHAVRLALAKEMKLPAVIYSQQEMIAALKHQETMVTIPRVEMK